MPLKLGGRVRLTVRAAFFFFLNRSSWWERWWYHLFQHPECCFLYPDGIDMNWSELDSPNPTRSNLFPSSVLFFPRTFFWKTDSVELWLAKGNNHFPTWLFKVYFTQHTCVFLKESTCLFIGPTLYWTHPFYQFCCSRNQVSSDQFTLVNFCIEGIILSSYMGIVKSHYNCRVPKGGVFKGGG